MVREHLYASLPWYDLPEARGATDAWWQGLRAILDARGIPGVPPFLDRVRPHDVHADRSCFFTQTCGYPLLTTARGHFTVLGAPRYRVAGCAGSLHRSYVVIRASSPVREPQDLRGARFAMNEPDSNSGMNLPRRLFAPFAREGRFFERTVLTGSHAASIELVASGGADAAAIDCVTYALLARYRPSALDGLRIVAETAASPTPPLVTSAHSSAEVIAALRLALAEFARDESSASIMEALFLDGIDFCSETGYEVVLSYEREAERFGYPVLA